MYLLVNKEVKFYSTAPKLQEVTVMRPGGLEPPTFGFEERKLKKLTPLESTNYNPPENHFSTNFSKKSTTIQQNLAKTINRWPSLPTNIRAAIMVLIGGDDE